MRPSPMILCALAASAFLSHGVSPLAAQNWPTRSEIAKNAAPLKAAGIAMD